MSKSYEKKNSKNGKPNPKYVDLLEEDKPVAGQKFVCMSFVSPEKIITNDIVEIQNSKQFKWLGRYDNVINSGGIKLFPEQIEAKLTSKLTNRFFISGQPDAVLGTKVILVIEGDKYEIDAEIFNSLSKFEKPKHIFFVSQFSETATNKVNRIQTLKSINVIKERKCKEN